MSNIICCDQSECSICSNSYFQDTYNLALYKKYDEIEFINSQRKLYRQSLIEEKTKNLNVDIKTYDYKEMFQEDSYFEDSLEFYNINNSNTFLDNLDSLIKLRDWNLLDFYCKKQDKDDNWTTEFCKKSTLEERERRSKKFLKRFFKQNPQFKQVSERKGCHSLLFFNPVDLKSYSIYISNEKDEDQNKFIESYSHEIVFLNNRNPRDGKNVTRSFIKNAVDAKKIVK